MIKRQTHRPFRHLKKLMQEHDVQMEELPAVRIATDDRQPGTPEEEACLFHEAMKGVQPIVRSQAAPQSPSHATQGERLSEDELVVRQLQRLVAAGKGFRVADTPEYIEGRDPCLPQEITRRLHAGAFSIQAHIDLHGLRVSEARQAVNQLLEHALRQGLRAVLIIHGRGLSSPGKPVLKSRLVRWLEHGSWRRWVLAYSSARLCDGGAGATYVLLRRRPEPKCRSKRRFA